MQKEMTPNEWFFAAEHAYANHHQSCAWCGETHCVRREKQDARHLYSCQSCDFQVSYDADRDQFQLIRGEEVRSCAETMLDQPIANLL